ncbi:MAG TPA: CpaF family protein, partial [Sphingomonadaceae bacterium]|nr:CpaF family protein [Sphingomonadaceae bacterium]
MSAFGRKNGVSGMAQGARPSFGVAKPMKGGDYRKPVPVPQPAGGDQFPPLPGDGPTADAAQAGSSKSSDAMARLADRANQIVDHSPLIEGFEASVH